MTSHTMTPPVPAQFSLFGDVTPLRNPESIDELPQTALKLVEVMGLEPAINLVKEYGGDDIKIPFVVNGTARMWAILVEIVGPEAAEKLVKDFPGGVIYVPKCYAALIRFRDKEIIRRFDAGVPFDTLRREHNFSRRHLYRVLKKSL